jgi:ribosomal protein S18 acetylase RimI-like enzyme
MVAARLKDARNDVVGAFDDGQLVGVAILRREPPGKTDHKAYLFGMYVLPEHRLHGVGRALLETIISRARERGLRQIQLSVTDANRAAIHLYQSCGFTHYGLERDAFRVGDEFYDVAHMALQLSDDGE